MMMRPPYGGRRRRVVVLSRHGALAVVDDPFRAGFGVMIEAASIGVAPVRYVTAAQAATVAETLTEMADFASAASDDGRRALTDDGPLVSAVHATMAAADGAIVQKLPSYGVESRTGRSYTEDYDDERREAKRAARAKARGAK
jgi:hypothetical protein